MAERKAEGYGLGGRVQWRRRALSAYTWFRTGKGPQRQWLHKIGKTEDASCPCGTKIQSGDHIVWDCRLHLSERRRNHMVGLKRWEDIDCLIWAAGEEADDPNDRVEGVERFFDYLSYQFWAPTEGQTALISCKWISSGGEGRLTGPNLNPSGLLAAYHRSPYGTSHVREFLKNKKKAWS